MPDVYLMYYEVPSKEEGGYFHAPYWKQMVSGNFKDDKSAIDYYLREFKPHYAPTPTRLTTMNPVTQRNARTVRIDGITDPLNKEGNTSTDNTMMIVVVVIVIVIAIAYFTMKKG